MITLALGERDARFSADGQPLSDALPLGAAMLCERRVGQPMVTTRAFGKRANGS